MIFAAAVWLLSAVPADTVQSAQLAVHALPGPEFRPLVRVGGILDDDALRNAVSSGLPIRVRVRVELWRDRWFDALEASRSWNIVLLFEPLSRSYVVRDESRPDSAGRYPSYEAARAAIERSYTPALRPAGSGSYYYTATLELETLSASDLAELERWLEGELGPAVSGDRSIFEAVGAGAMRLMVKLLGLPTRRVEARSDRFETG